jgi:site-specific recombinase XerD
MENSLSLRDRSIGLLLIFSGIRAIDISLMKCSSIDWIQSSLSFIQEKTDQPVEIPMNSVTGNMIYDYITKERPDSDNQYLFLPESSHHKGHLSSTGIANIVKKLFRVAKIRQNPGDRQGTHIFRHHLATSLLENNVSCPVITNTLGHTSPTSLEDYIRADFKHLKDCSLSIDQFPVGNGVFGS